MGKFSPVVTSEPDTPDEPFLTGKYVAVKIADTELSTSETAATGPVCIEADVVGQRKAPPPEHRACLIVIRTR
ncbi:hypothetical protein E4U31_007716, partial [Claviceps sp. LM219 group G6]